MADPVAWRLEEETAADRLRATLAETEAELRRHAAALLKLQGELIAARLEVSGARGETVQVRGLLRQAEAFAQAVQARGGIAGWDAETMRLRAVIASLEAETAALRAGMDLLRASASWRASAPIRVAGLALRRLRASARGRRGAIRWRPAAVEAVQAVEAVAQPGDPNAAFVFQAARSSADREGVVTLDALYHLSRSL